VEGEYNPESEHSIVWTTNPEVKKIVKYFFIQKFTNTY
jgi:hypothetical protein